MRTKLTLRLLQEAAKSFCKEESIYQNTDLYGITDGKAVGTYVEQKFQKYLSDDYDYEQGSSARGIDLPSKTINTDIKVTSIRQPQSSCPFKDAKQKIFGLGYHLLVFVYDKIDDANTATARLDFVHCSFIEKERTADHTTTYRLREMIQDGAIREDIIAYLNDKNIPADEITLGSIADKVLKNPPKQGYLTISNALQWRLQYARIVNSSEVIEGIESLVNKTDR